MLGIVPLLFSALAFALAPNLVATQQAQAARRSPLQNIDVTGTIAGGGRFVGQLDLVSFTVVNNALVANGLLDGRLFDSNGQLVGSVTNELVTGLPVDLGAGAAGNAAAPQRVCDILHLELGPLDLDLLGLVVHLNRVVLDINAVSGPGNLLGNLLCAVVGLLDGPPSLDILNQIADLLNRIIDLFG
jgi:hypothetical protein